MHLPCILHYMEPNEHQEKGKRKIHFQSREEGSPLQELHTDGRETSTLSNP